jgi:hypothetical protein
MDIIYKLLRRARPSNQFSRVPVRWVEHLIPIEGRNSTAEYADDHGHTLLFRNPPVCPRDYSSSIVISAVPMPYYSDPWSHCNLRRSRAFGTGGTASNVPRTLGPAPSVFERVKLSDWFHPVAESSMWRRSLWGTERVSPVQRWASRCNTATVSSLCPGLSGRLPGTVGNSLAIADIGGLRYR